MNTPILQTHDLSIGYGQQVIASHLHLTLFTGELVCLIGQNGAGKSTLMRTLAGLQAPLAGTVTLMGDALAHLTARERAKRLSIVTTERTDTALMTGELLVSLGRHPYTDWTGQLSATDERVVRWAIQAVGATALATRRVSELSDGERQKLMIARALAQEPAVMLLDEPTAFLDVPRRVETLNLLRQLAHTTQRAILLSTHDLDLALRMADMVWLMTPHQGLVIGTPEELVLSGAFERAFASDGVTFDPMTGAFRWTQATRGSLRVVGDGLPALWTRRALGRLGYTVTDDAPDTVRVTGDGWVWREAHYPTLRDWLQALLGQ